MTSPASASLALLTACICGASLAMGCATVAGGHQVVSLDSSPRGAMVTRTTDGSEVGRTPLLIAQPRGAMQDYSLQFADGAAARVVVRCDAREPFMVADVMAALPLVALPPPLGPLSFVAAAAALVSIDVADGAIFDCPLSMRARHPVAAPGNEGRDGNVNDTASATLPGLAPDSCPRFVIAPPAAQSEAASQRLASAAGQAARAAWSCATVVEAAAASAAFARQGASFREPVASSPLARSVTQEVAFETRATHVVLVDVDARAAPAVAQLRIVDVHSLQAVTGPTIPVLSLDPPAEPDLFHDTLRFAAGFIPDTLVWNVAAKAFPYESTRGETIVSSELAFPILSTALNFQLYHLDHPQNHSLWDIQPSIAPDVVVQLNGTRMTWAGEATETRALTLTVLQVVAPLSPRLTFFTPLGMTAAWMGVGPGFVVDMNEPEYRVTSRFTAFAHGGLSHHVFLTRMTFVGVAAQANRSFWPHVERDGVRLDWFFQVSANLGLTLPDLTDQVRALL